ncbi:MAG: SDR family oxidoreductase, partial [Candidatus Omnitrophica bacterium]|nr:SDR family oxidoreductase [Candidatus Omnitrophota bacterium]
MKFLVTGGAGFIGSHIAERLLKEGHFVRILDNFSGGKEENLSFVRHCEERPSVIARTPSKSEGDEAISFELIRGDIRDYSTCLKACDGMDYVFHQAALKSVPVSLDQPHEYNAVNIDGTVNMLEAARQCKIKRFVFASSSAIYGEAVSFPQKETDELLLISPYALNKLAGEYYCRIFSKNYGLETVSLRYFNVFGPRQDLNDEYAGVIRKFIDFTLNDKSPTVHGDGRQSRDFVYVDDVVNANILAATSILNTQCSILNVGSGTETSILDIVDALSKITNKNILPVYESSRQGDIRRTLADISKIKEQIGCSPKFSFYEGLKLAYASFSEQQFLHRHCEPRRGE